MKIRSKQEIRAAEQKFSELAWFYRFMYRCLSRKVDPKQQPGWEGAAEIAKKYPQIEPLSDHDFGELYGKICALRWVMGEDWGNLAVL